MTIRGIGLTTRVAAAAGLLGVMMGGATTSPRATPAWAAPAIAQAEPASEEAVTAVARQLRCVVCQNLSVADSPSEMARQMRDLIREQLAAGRPPDEVVAYFVTRYGDWVLLTPPARGFNLLLWGLPFLGLVGGLGLVLIAARRWTRRASTETPPPAAAGLVDRERIRAEIERLRD